MWRRSRTILRQADSIHDIAQALTDERAEGGNAPLLHWSNMLRANVLSHRRDIEADDAAAAQLAARLTRSRAARAALRWPWNSGF